MDSLVVYPLKHIIPKKKNGNGFNFPYKPNFTICISEKEVTLIWFSLLISKIMLIFQGIRSIFLWLNTESYGWFAWGTTSGFQKNHWEVCMWLLLGNSLMLCLPIPSSLGPWQGRFAWRHTFSSCLPHHPEGEPFGALQLWMIFLITENRGVFMRQSVRIHKSIPDSWYAMGEELKPKKWEMCQDAEYRL